MAQHLAVYREHAPGFANAYLLLSAPQLGVRHARRLVGVGRVTREDWSNATPRPDEIGISPSPGKRLHSRASLRSSARSASNVSRRA